MPQQSTRSIGDIFTADKQQWQVYAIEPDGTICSRFVSQAPNIQKLDYTQGCAYTEHGRPGHVGGCRDYVVAGTRFCRKHQYVQRYYVDDTPR